MATDKIENQPLINFRLFLSSLFLKPIEAYAKESITNLEEIKDKEYAQQIIDRVKSISSSNQSYQEEYDKSAWSSYFSAKEAYENYQDLPENPEIPFQNIKPFFRRQNNPSTDQRS